MGRRLDAFVDGELDAGRAAAVQTHIEECIDCNAVVRLMFNTKRCLRARIDQRADSGPVQRLTGFATALTQSSASVNGEPRPPRNDDGQQRR